jgi:hypothetical protein
MAGDKLETLWQTHHRAFAWAQVLEDVFRFAAADTFYLVLVIL